jgi:hypothetical protein
MTSSKRRKARTSAPIRSHGRITVCQPDGTTVTYSQRVPVTIVEGPQAWPEGSLELVGEGSVRPASAPLLSVLIGPRVSHGSAMRDLVFWSLFKRWALRDWPGR